MVGKYNKNEKIIIYIINKIPNITQKKLERLLYLIDFWATKYLWYKISEIVYYNSKISWISAWTDFIKSLDNLEDKKIISIQKAKVCSNEEIFFNIYEGKEIKLLIKPIFSCFSEKEKELIDSLLEDLSDFWVKSLDTIIEKTDEISNENINYNKLFDDKNTRRNSPKVWI